MPPDSKTHLALGQVILYYAIAIFKKITFIIVMNFDSFDAMNQRTF
jgi:hypothetical protein